MTRSLTRRTLRPLLAASLLATTVAPATVAQTKEAGKPTIAPRVLRAHVAFLADDAVQGRGTGTWGGRVAADYIAAQFRRLGLQPAGDSGTYFQRFTMLGRTPSPELRAVAGKDTASLRPGAEFVVAPETDDTLTQVSGDVVFGGYGVVAPNRGWDDYAGADLTGKIVLVLPGNPDSARFDPFTGRPWSAVREKADEAARRGAVAVLVVDAGPTAIPWQATAALTRERVGLPYTGGVKFWGWISDSAGASLLARAGQDLGRLVQQARTPGFRATPLPLRLDATVRTALRPVPTQNVIAKLPGRGPHADEAFVVGAHYDHLGIGAPVNGDSIYNGAEDNASGTAAVLGTAEAIVRMGARPARSLYFVAFTAEELGLQGSDWFVRRGPIPPQKMIGAVAMDVVNLYGATRDIGTVGVDQSTLGDAVRAAARAEGLTINEDPDDLRRGRFFRSDNYAFARAGIPALRIVNGVDFVGRPKNWGREMRERFWNERYHRPNDQLADWMSFDGIAQQVRVLARMTLAVADAPGRPAWAKNSDFRVIQEGAR
ncbi:MAG TPA: M28 family peptidase [Gemmatimonadales bacterium]|nr:M28 family peptidase [Gemmatimonadales bacterium]